jgi:hydroxyacylglutathione hydrolase
MEVIALPAFEDNYIWALVRPGRCIVVDPGEADPVLDLLRERELTLTAILVTHHHGDHVAGIRELLDHANVPVYGPAAESIPHRGHALAGGERLDLGEFGTWRVIAVPGHTLGHIAYYAAHFDQSDDVARLFCGDTLFACGCGRLFEGTPVQMQASLAQLKALPGDTLAYCAHEYTLSNLRFARHVEPDNAELATREARDRALRARGLPTVPFTLALETATNPFLRWDAPAVSAFARRCLGRDPESDVETFAAVRRAKDVFAPA